MITFLDRVYDGATPLLNAGFSNDVVPTTMYDQAKCAQRIN